MAKKTSYKKEVKSFFTKINKYNIKDIISIDETSIKEIVAYKFYEKGGLNKERFLDFLQINILSKMKNKLLLFDNPRSHIANNVLESIKISGNDYIKYTLSSSNKPNRKLF